MYALILVCIGSCIYNRQCFLLVESLCFDENRDSCQKQQTAAYTKSIPLLQTAVDLFSELVLLSLELINTDSFIYSLFFALIFFFSSDFVYVLQCQLSSFGRRNFNVNILVVSRVLFAIAQFKLSVSKSHLNYATLYVILFLS